MTLAVADRVQETTTTTGTGTYTLAGAKAGFQSFAAVGDGNTTYYACTDGTDYEVGIGTYTASGTTLARTTIIESSNSDAAVNWGAGEKDIFVTLPASKAVFEDGSDNVTINSLVTSSNGNIDLDPDGSGKVVFKGNSTKGSGQFVLNCENNSHGIVVKGPPHSAGANYTLTLPNDDGASGQSIISDGSGNLSFSTITSNATHTGEVTGSTALTISDNVVDEANLKVSNSPVDGYILTARSGNTGGLTWEEVGSAGLAEQEFTATSGQTVFTVSGGITDADNVSVYLNGAKLFSTDVTISAAANTVTLATGATTGDLITVTEITGAASGGGGSGITTGKAIAMAIVFG